MHRYITIPPSALRAATSLCTREALGCSVQHIFNKDSVSGGRIVDKDVSNGADQFSVLDDGRAGHECVKCRTKLFSIFSDIFLKYVEKSSMRVVERINTI